MPLANLDHAGIARSLSQIADHRRDIADAFFERLEEVELPPDDRAPGFRVRRESGVAVRMVRRDRTWLATRDGISQEAFSGAVRRVARALPRASYPEPSFAPDRWPEPPEAPEVLALPAALQRAVRGHHVSFPYRLTVRRHRRWVRSIGTQLASGVERESYYSLEVEMAWGRYGCLLPELDDQTAEPLAGHLVHAYRAHDAEPPEPWDGASVLGPAASAVLLHEAVAHALEADTLALGGHPEAAIGVTLAHPSLNVFDDPSTAPESVRRGSDDEGCPVVRRCLLRQGVIEQPLADGVWAQRSEMLRPGSGRRAHRHVPPGPRSSHLELATGEAAREDLMAEAEGGLFLPEADRGRLDPATGEFVLHFPHGYRIRDHAPGSPVGPSTMRAHVTDVLQAVRAVGRDAVAAGAGWCAKGGMKLPVWATTPDLLIAGVRIQP